MNAHQFPSNNIVVLDLETQHSAESCIHCDAGKAFHESHPVFCQGYAPRGWDNHQLLGLSIGAYWDYQDGRIHWLDRTTVGTIIATWIHRSPLIVSFNGKQFDLPLMHAVATDQQEVQHILAEPWRYLIDTSYDILDAIWQADPERKFERGLNSLGAIAEANGFGPKLGHGAEAPVQWAHGEYATVLNYCADDVLKTKSLFEQICAMGQIMRGDGQAIELPRPGWSTPEKKVT